MDIRSLIDKGPLTRLQIIIILVCFMITVLDGMDVLVIAYSAPLLAEEWAIQPQSLGAVFSAGLFGMALGAMLIAPYSDVIGRRSIVLISVLVISSGIFATAFASSVLQLIFFRFLTGLGIGSMLASVATMTAEYSPDRYRNLTIGFVQSGYAIGATLTGLFAAWLLPEYGWRALFIIAGVVTAAIFPVVYFLMPESIDFLVKKQPRGALDKINRVLKKMGHTELSELPESSAIAKKPSVKILMTDERRSSTLRLWLAFFMAFLTMYFLISWIPKIAVDAGLPLEQAIYAGTAFNLGAFVGALILGYFSSRFGLNFLIMLYMFVAAVLMVIFGVVAMPLSVLLVIIFFIGFTVQGGFIGLYSVAARLYPTELRTTGVGWAIGAGRTGAIIGPYMAGILIGMGSPLSINFLIFALPMVIAGIAAVSIKTVIDKSVDAA